MNDFYHYLQELIPDPELQEKISDEIPDLDICVCMCTDLHLESGIMLIME